MKLPPTIAASFFAATTLLAETATFESDDTPATLLELFTSEGCSSCPSADAWVSKLKTEPALWKRIVPVVFHVDYWNYLGWSDRFANAANTARQYRYAAAWRNRSVYTPGFVANGREWREWSSRAEWPRPASMKVGKLTLSVREAQARVSFAPADGVPTRLQVEVALLGSNLESDVKRGENSGRKLRHDFTVLHLASAPLRAENGRLVATLSLARATGDAPKAVAAWITPDDGQPPIQAIGGWLPKL
jgi:hypothetical protein